MNALGMIAGSTVLMISIVLLSDGVPDLTLSAEVWGALFGIATLSTVFAYFLYFVILERAGASNLLLVTLLIPPFAIALGVLFLEERMMPEAWFGFAIIAVGFAVTDGRVLARLQRRFGGRVEE